MSNISTFNLSIIAERYAVAIFELAEQNNLLDKIGQDLSLINNTIQSSKELDAFLVHPTIPVEEKKEVIEKIFKNLIAQYTLNFVKLLLDRNRLFILPSIIGHYIKILNKKRNITVAEVITAIYIDEETITRVREKLEILFHSKIELKTSVDSEIIAGMIIKISDKVIDGSIKTKFENMKKQLI